MTQLIFYIDNLERLKFFNRFYDSNNQYKLSYITFKLSIYLLLKLRGKDVRLLRYHKKVGFEVDRKILDSSLDVLEGSLSDLDAAKVYASLENHLMNLCCLNDTKILIWNGTKLVGRVLNKLKYKYKYQTIFMELSNLPNAIFVDPEGVNAESRIYRSLSQGRPIPRSEIIIDKDWLYHYRTYKSAPPRQLKYIGKFNLWFFVDMIAQIFKVTPRECSLKFWDRVKIIINNKRTINFKFGDNCDLSIPYLFLPLQVSTDSQLKFNSDTDNITAIKNAYKVAIDTRKKLYVKIHPSEMDAKFVYRVKSLVSELGDCILTSDNTVDLIESSDEVFVINSTVGLESKILGKNVTIYGRAIYEYVGCDISSFINFVFLSEVDYFSDDLINLSNVIRKNQEIIEL